jgi:hypothetical protein
LFHFKARNDIIKAEIQGFKFNREAKMKRALIIFLAVIVLPGCASYYRVRVNGYSDGAQSADRIQPGASFYVRENKNASNLLLEKEIKNKIETLLQDKGYSINSYETAGYLLDFVYTMGSGRTVSDVQPVYTPGERSEVETVTSSGKVRRSYVTTPGYTTYVPYKITQYTASLTLTVLDAGLIRSVKEEKPLWIGEISSVREDSDLREAVNYLLVAGFGQFGKNTGKSFTVTVSGDAPQLKKLLRQY